MIPYPFLLILLFFFSSCLALEPNDQLEEANRSYRQGEQATIWIERKKAFNQALSLYLELENQFKLFNDSNKLYEAIADSYFQLGEYAWSILYSYRALELKPQDRNVQDQLYRAQEKLGLPPHTKIARLNRFLSFNRLLSLPQRFELFFWLSVITLSFFSLSIWFPLMMLLKRLTHILLGILCFLLTSAVFNL